MRGRNKERGMRREAKDGTKENSGNVKGNRSTTAVKEPMRPKEGGCNERVWVVGSNGKAGDNEK